MTNIFPRPLLYSGTVIGKTYLNAKTVKLEIKVENPAGFSFIAGQFINLKVSQYAFRSYSIASFTGLAPVISIILTVAHDGLGSNYVKLLKTGDSVDLIGPSGRFVLPEHLEKNLLFLITGTGLAPIIPMLYELMQARPDSEIELYLGFKNDEDVFEEDFLKTCINKFKSFKYYMCVSRPSPKWTGLTGRITDFYKVKGMNNTQSFICGNPDMVSDMLNRLKLLGIAENKIFYEKFVVSSS